MGVPNTEDTTVIERQEEEVARFLNGGEGPVSSLILKGFKTYEWSKQKAFENKRIAGTVGPAVGFIEDTVVTAAKLSPIKVDKVVSVMDSGVEGALKYGQNTKETVVSTINDVAAKPGEIKKNTLTNLHNRLEKFRKQDETTPDVTSVKPEDVGFKVIYSDVKTLTDQGANKILDVSEKYVDKYLHEEKNVEEEGEELGVRADTTTGRAFQLSKVVTKRMQRRAMAGLRSLKLRTKRVVHVDLMKYSKMLDYDAMKERLGNAKESAKETFENRVAVPSRNLKAGLCHRYEDVKAVTDRYQKQIREKIMQIRIPYQDEIKGYVNYVKETCDKRIIKPVEEIIETLKKDYEAEVKKIEKEQDPNKPHTIEAGARALVSAARYRMNVLMEQATGYFHRKAEQQQPSRREPKGVGKVRLERVNGEEEEDEALYDAADE